MDSSSDTCLAMDACPPLEDIAAFLDCTLSAEERDRIVAHLADCETCYEMFAGAADFLTGKPKDLETMTEPEGKVVRFPFPSRTTPPRWLAAAAAAALVVVVVGGGFVYRDMYTQPKLAVAELTEPVLSKAGIVGQLYDWSRFRGLGSPSGFEEEDARRAFIVGARLVDLGLSSHVGDVEQTQEALRAIGEQLDNALLMDAMAKRYLAEKEKVKTASDAREIAEQIQARERELESDEASTLLPEYLAFGKWAESGHVAAALENPAFFEDRTNRRFLSWLLRQEEEPEQPGALQLLLSRLQHRGEMPLDSEVLDPLQRIQDTLAQGDLQKTDYEALKASFDSIIGHYDI